MIRRVCQPRRWICTCSRSYHSSARRSLDSLRIRTTSIPEETQSEEIQPEEIQLEETQRTEEKEEPIQIRKVFLKAKKFNNLESDLEFQRLLDSWPDPANSTARAGAEKPQLQLPKKFLQNHLDSSLSKVFHVSREIRHAVGTRQPVVALESTIYTHGFPYPDNIDLALGLEKIVRDHGGIPATVGVLNGRIRVGLNEDEITELASAAGKPHTMKVSRRDIPYITGMVSFDPIMSREINILSA